MPKGITEVTCTNCGMKFKGGHRRLLCNDCQTKLWYTCPDCGEIKRGKYSKWCYFCSLKHRDTSRYGRSIQKMIAATVPLHFQK